MFEMHRCQQHGTSLHRVVSQPECQVDILKNIKRNKAPVGLAVASAPSPSNFGLSIQSDVCGKRALVRFI